MVKQDIVHDSMPISIPTTWVVTTASGIGEEEDPDIIIALSQLQLSLCSQLRTYRDFSTRRPSRQDERELIVDRQSSQRMPGAATSPIVASRPDGRGAVYSRRSLFVSKRAACDDEGSPVASTRIADA